MAVEADPAAALLGGDLDGALQAAQWDAAAPLWGVLVLVRHTQGSAPRAAGAWMLVTPDQLHGTIGGGQFEWHCMAQARALLQAGVAAPPQVQRQALGPSLGQCCGGVMVVQFECLAGAQAAQALRQRWHSDRAPVALFGGGHVGRALVQALQPLPFDVYWVDSREGVFPPGLPAWVRCEHSQPVQRAVADLPAHSRVLVMSFSHAEDFDVVQAALQRQRERADIQWLGLMGSRSKWATFRHRLAARGFTPAEFDFVTCPIGLPGISGKQPEVIAASVVAQLLQQG